MRRAIGAYTPAAPRTAVAILVAAGLVGCSSEQMGPATPPVAVTTAALPSARVAEPYSTQLTATGGTGSYTWTVVAGALPAGLTLASSGLLGGTPTSAGSHAFEVQVSSGGETDAKALTLQVDPELVAVETQALPRAWVDIEYDEQLEATGGTGGYQWSLAEGVLPAGIILTADGRLAGTPPGETSTAFTVEVTSGGIGATAEFSLSVGRTECAVQKQPELPAPSSAWEWTQAAIPLGFEDNTWVQIDPEDANIWYAGGESGLFTTHDGGGTWSRPFTVHSQSPVEFVSDDPCTVYAMASKFAFTPPLGESYSRLLRSTDRGRTWSTVYEVPVGYIRSIHVGRFLPELLLIGVQVDLSGTEPDRFYRSTDRGETWSVQEIDGAQRQLIPWDIEEDVNGVLYSGTEIADHPDPYEPPFLRSMDGGVTWQDLSGILPWHVVSIQTHPTTTRVYALTEGAGLYTAPNSTLIWQLLSTPEVILTLLVDPRVPDRMYGGTHTFGGRPGGVFASLNGGSTFVPVGLQGIVVGHLAVGHEGRVLYAAGYQSGLWRATIPE